MFQFISNDPVICARYNYAEMKCSHDKWIKDNSPPDWFVKIKRSILIKKKTLIDKIMYQTKEKLPSLVSKGNKVFRFHSFLRICYDHLFQGKWDVKAKMMNKYNKNKSLIYQLTFPQLYYIYKISKSLENKKILVRLNIQSLRYRNKLKFPDNKINYRNNPEYYIYTSNVKNIFQIEPYTNEIEVKLYNSKTLYYLFLNYIKTQDFIGADIIRRYVQINHFCKELLLIENNKLYNEWCNSFNWKKTDPYKPNNYIFI
jgi:hypothetical protein